MYARMALRYYPGILMPNKYARMALICCLVLLYTVQYITIYARMALKCCLVLLYNVQYTLYQTYYTDMLGWP